MTDSAETFTVEYSCDWLCRIELDLTDISDRYTHRQMRAATLDYHLAVHAGGPVRAEFTVTNTQVKAGAR